MDRPRILLILTEFPPRVGGMQTHALYLSHYLAAQGYPVAVATYRPADDEERAAVDGYDAHLPFPVHRCLSRLGFWHNFDVLASFGRHFAPNLVYASTVFYGLLGQRLSVPVVCRSVGNDVLRPWIAYPFRQGSRLLSRPRIEQRLYATFQRLKRPEWVETLFRQARRSIMVRSARAAQRVLANSAFTASLLKDIGLAGDRVEVVVGGVDVRRFAPPAAAQAIRQRLGLPDGRYLVVTACRLEPKKGVDFLLAAFARLRHQMADAHLVVVGDGRQRAQCQQLARQLGVADRVTFTGRVPHEAVHQYYWSADLFVLASREYVHPATGLRDAETMGRVLCEANAAGVPVVAARSGGIPSVVTHGENGLLFEPDNLDDFWGQVSRLRAERELAARLVHNGRAAADSRFDWSVVMAAHERAFAEVLQDTQLLSLA